MGLESKETFYLESNMPFERLYRISKECGYYWVWDKSKKIDTPTVDESFINPGLNRVVTFNMPRGED